MPLDKTRAFVIGRTKDKSDFVVDLNSYGINEIKRGKVEIMTPDRKNIGVLPGDLYIIASIFDNVEEKKLSECPQYIGDHINKYNIDERMYYFRCETGK